MGKYSYYDPREGIIFVDVTRMAPTVEALDQIIDEVIEMSRHLAQKPFIVSDWRGARFTPEMARQYRKRVPELLSHVEGIVRYGMDDLSSRVYIRDAMIKQRSQEAASAICADEREAIATVRRLRQRREDLQLAAVGGG